MGMRKTRTSRVVKSIFTTDYLVEIRDFSLCYVRIFVTAAEKDDFFAKWYLDFLSRAAAINQTRTLDQIARTSTAFVRHGTGEDTIDREGEQTLDDVRGKRVRWQERRGNLSVWLVFGNAVLRSSPLSPPSSSPLRLASGHSLPLDESLEERWTEG
jgi:hypothetical protein